MNALIVTVFGHLQVILSLYKWLIQPITFCDNYWLTCMRLYI